LDDREKIQYKTLQVWFTLISTTFELVTIICSVKHQHKNSSVLEATLPNKISHRQQQRTRLVEKQNGCSNSISLVLKNPMIPGG
jgi:hypothetical protein